MAKEIRKLLVANRGEIARRVIRTAHAMGIQTVAVHGGDDADAAHVREADEAVWLGDESEGIPYLVIEGVLDAAKRTGADAIHPCYGFLAERADFAQAVLDAGLTWVGPPPAVMTAMAEKDAAKRRAKDASVPVLEGFELTGVSTDEALRRAETLGFPLLIKAVAGGGGRGMRVVRKAEDFIAQMGVAAAEAAKSFGDDRLLIERYVASGRHVEVQVFGDEHGNVLHLHERECSVQRRHQKIIEESPSPGISDQMRADICGAAVRLAERIGYIGAGTVEFLVDEGRGDFAFLEVNARVQVEHPVTELRTGVDIVRWQLLVAQGERLPLTQAQVVASGHAIEARLCAEDPAQDHRPQAGPVRLWRAGEGARVDTLFQTRAGHPAGHVSIHYDSMVAKVITAAPTRQQAIRMLDRALGRTAVLGLQTNRSFLRAILADEAFVAGDTTTDFLTRRPLRVAPEQADDETLIALAAWLAGGGLTRFRNNAHRPDITVLWEQQQRLHVGLTRDMNGSLFAAVEREPDPDLFETVAPERVLQVLTCDERGISCRIDGHRRDYVVAQHEDWAWVQQLPGPTHALRVGTLLPEPEVDEVAEGSVVTETAAVVAELHVAVGDEVKADAPLVTVEAMKMLAVLRAPTSGTVVALHAEAGQSVAAGQVLVEIE